MKDYRSSTGPSPEMRHIEEQHAKRDMTARQQHTPEPWTVYHVNKTLAIEDGKGHEHINAVVQWPGFDSGDKPLREKVANARRIVACVNACAGIDTGFLEGWAIASSQPNWAKQHEYLAAQRDKLKAAHGRALFQRDALANALRHFREWHGNHFGDFDGETNAQLVCLDNEAEAALAKLNP